MISMKKKLCLLFSAILIFACFPQKIPLMAAGSPSVTPKKLTIGIGKTTQTLPKLKIVHPSAKAVYQFTSSNKSVAVVGKTTGTVTGRKKGTAVITITETKNKKTTIVDRVTIAVKDTPKKRVSVKTLELKKGESRKLSLTAYFLYLNANAAYTFESSHPSMLSVKKEANLSFTVLAKKAGSGSISIIQTEKGKKKKVGSLSFTIKESSTDAAEALLNMPLEDILEKIYENVTEELPKRWNQKITKDNSSYYFGIDNMEFEEAIASEGMNTSIPFSVCLARLPKGSDVEAVKKEIQEKVDPRKWICVGVEPENVLVGNIDRLVILVMSNTGAKKILDSFLSLASKSEAETYYVPDKNKILKKGEYYSKAMEPYQASSVKNLGDKINRICSAYLKDSKSVYYSIIPDKSYFIPNQIFTKKDYRSLIATLNKQVTEAVYLPILDTLSLADYYKTDLHWRQERILDTVNTLGQTMGFQIQKSFFEEKKLSPYQGIYSPYIKTPPSETLIYLTSDKIKAAQTENYGDPKKQPVYRLDKWSSDVPYDIFLSGPNPLITIVSPKAESDRELLIFGDSFMSSLAPLLTHYYSKITLLDLRFLSSSHLENFISFHGQDVLFLYNTAVINRSAMLK